MKLQQKTALVFIGLLIILMIVVSVFSSIVILSSYTDLEQQYTERDIRQAVTRIDDESLTLSAIVSDWGPWDDSYDYVLGTKPDFVEKNLAPETFENLRLQVIIFTNRSGGIVYSSGYDPDSGMIIPVPDDLSRQLDSQNPLMDLSDPRKATRGIILLEDHPMIIASRPIVRTDFSGEPQGVVIMGRYLDDNEVNRLAQLTLPSLAFIRVDDPALSPAILQSIREAAPESRWIVRPLDSFTIEAYALLKDIYGSDALVLRISEPRSIYLQGTMTTLKFIWVILFSGLVFGLVVMVLLDKLVLSRLGTLIHQVHTIGDNTRESDRLDIGGEDEFSGLAREINRMLDTIDTIRTKVQQSEKRFRDLTGLLPQIVFEMDFTGKILYINKAGSDLFNITEKRIADGITIRDFVSAESVDLMDMNFTRVTRGEKSAGDTYTLVRPDGSTMKALVTTSPIRRENRITGFRGVVVDVTEQIRLQEALEESTKLVMGILQASPVGVFQLDAPGRVTFVNETFSTITGIPFEAIRGKYWADIIPSGDRQQLLAQMQPAIRELRMTRSETRYNHPNGSVYWLLGQAVPMIDSSQKLTGWVGTITDITERKTFEDALRESEEKYRALTENTGDVLFSTDMDGRITYVSPQVNKYGYLVEEVVGQTLERFIHPEDIERVRLNLSSELEKGAQFVSTFRIRDKWRNTHWIEEKSSLRLDHQGKALGIYGILRDVSDRKHAEDAMELANKKLNLMNNITRHDILNTLTGLFGLVDMAVASGNRDDLLELLVQIKELGRIIQRQITFTREYQDVGVRAPVWQNIREVINRTIQNFGSRGVTFSVEVDDNEIFADPLLEKVFYNLVDNAIRYGERLTAVRFYYHVLDGELTLVCEDNGIGIPENTKEQIFERGVGKNTGMGLFLTREILLITGIRIRENGTYGKGARFEMLIPFGTWRFVKK